MHYFNLQKSSGTERCFNALNSNVSLSRSEASVWSSLTYPGEHEELLWQLLESVACDQRACTLLLGLLYLRILKPSTLFSPSFQLGRKSGFLLFDLRLFRWLLYSFSWRSCRSVFGIVKCLIVKFYVFILLNE